MSLAAGAVVAILAFSLSMAFRRRFRGDGIAFYVIMLALMAPGFLLGLGTQLFWKAIGETTSLWHTALGANTVWGIPFGFLVMVAIWNRYDDHIDEAARDLGANAARTFAEVTLPLVWTGIFGALPVRVHADVERLRPNGAARDRRSHAPARDRRSDPELARSAPISTRSGRRRRPSRWPILFAALAVIWVRSRFRRAPVHRVEEELGLGGGIDAEAAETVAQA